jgi:hypothetical protein
VEGLLRHGKTLTNSPQNVETFDKSFFVELITLLKEEMVFFSVILMNLVKILKREKRLLAFQAFIGLNLRFKAMTTGMADFKQGFFTLSFF